MGGIKKAVKSVTKSIKTAVSKTVGGAFGLKTDKPKVVEQAPPAQEAPKPEQNAEGVSTPEELSTRKRNRRNGLRIDLNNAGAANTGSGLNIPVG
ncbi:hypothetical protein [Pseudomonas sp. Sample_16]|uniref:hypothetical protein n=1 Tax=Pseudomonas sp. Sample_16 TaxID=2448263 RepID=UPI001033017D|nr:hypothetical protein [Pseudomonas sp. Sample_16]